MCFFAVVEVEIWAHEWYKILVPSFLVVRTPEISSVEAHGVLECAGRTTGGENYVQKEFRLAFVIDNAKPVLCL